MSMLAASKPPSTAPGGGNHATRNAALAAPRRAMPRRYLNILINLTLLALVGVSFVTGWIASLLGLTEFGLHKYSSIALLLVASGHVVLHWRSLTVQLRNLGTGRYDRRNPAQPDRRNPAQLEGRVSGSRSGVSPLRLAPQLGDRQTKPVESGQEPAAA